MMLRLKVPHNATFDELVQLLGSYVLSFIYVGIFWNNHHHMLHMVHKISGGVLWANLHLLFWLSLIPFVTGWMGENHFAVLPVAAYGVVLLFCGVAYSILARTLVSHHRENAELGAAIGDDRKGKVSIALYLLGVGLSLVQPWFGFLVYAAVAVMWLIPDRRIERRVIEKD